MRLRATVFRGVRRGLASAIIGAPIAAQQDAPKPAVPVDAISAILDAFRSHAIVALGDAHGNQQAQAFLRSLVRDLGSPPRSTTSSSSSATRATRVSSTTS